MQYNSMRDAVPSEWGNQGPLGAAQSGSLEQLCVPSSAWFLHLERVFVQLGDTQRSFLEPLHAVPISSCLSEGDRGQVDNWQISAVHPPASQMVPVATDGPVWLSGGEAGCHHHPPKDEWNWQQMCSTQRAEGKQRQSAGVLPLCSLKSNRVNSDNKFHFGLRASGQGC